MTGSTVDCQVSSQELNLFTNRLSVERLTVTIWLPSILSDTNSAEEFVREFTFSTVLFNLVHRYNVVIRIQSDLLSPPSLQSHNPIVPIPSHISHVGIWADHCAHGRGDEVAAARYAIAAPPPAC